MSFCSLEEVTCQPAQRDPLFTPFLSNSFALMDVKYDGVDQLRELFEKLQKDLSLDSAVGKRLIIVFDGVDEAPTHPHAVFQRVLEMIYDVASFSWIRIIVSVRREFLD